MLERIWHRQEGARDKRKMKYDSCRASGVRLGRSDHVQGLGDLWVSLPISGTPRSGLLIEDRTQRPCNQTPDLNNEPCLAADPYEL